MNAAPSERPLVSVIVPFYGRPEELEPCLAGLLAQGYPQDRYELIVVDNGTTLEAHQASLSDSRVRLLRESKKGSYAARNRGLAEARGAVLAFTDGDCLPSRGWIEAGVAALESEPTPAFAGGRIDMSYLDPEKPRIAELYDELFSSFDQRANVEDKGFSVTANLFTTPAVFDQVGTFDASLKSRGDLAWGERVRAAGLPGTYADDAIVGHPCRNTFAELLAKARRLTGGHHDQARPKRFSLLRHLKWMLVFATVQPLRELAFARRRGVPAALSKRLGVAGYIVVLNWLRVIERLRLVLGGESRR